jgi:hypothetical protein
MAKSDFSFAVLTGAKRLNDLNVAILTIACYLVPHAYRERLERSETVKHILSYYCLMPGAYCLLELPVAYCLFVKAGTLL